MSDMELLYADKRIAVAVKPPGILSTDEPGGMPELLRRQLGTPCIRTVHRLDAATGGVMVFARSAAAASILSGQVRDHQFRKTYLAVVGGDPGHSGTWRGPAGPRPGAAAHGGGAGPGPDARPAELDFQRLASGTACHWCGSPCIPAAPTRSGCSLPAGLPLVGTGNMAAPGTARRWPLWSWRLGFTHPETGRSMVFTHQPPAVWPWTLFPLPETGR